MTPQLLAALPRLLAFGILTGGCAGAVVHLLFARFAKQQLNLRRFLIDCSLGAAGFLGGIAAGLFIRLPAHTETRRVADVVIRETTTRLQHPYVVALALSIALPAVLELRLARKRSRAGNERK